MKIKPNLLAILIPVIMMGGYLVLDNSTLLNETEVSNSVNENSSEENTAFESITGNTSLQSIADAYDIDVSILYDVFQIDESLDTVLFKSKDLESIYVAGDVEIGNESIQVFVNFYNDLTVVYEDETWLPQKAVDYLLENVSSLSDEDRSYLESHGVEVVLIDPSTIVLSEAESTVTEAESSTINGTTTLQNIIDMGLTQTELETILGVKIQFTNQLFKDFCADKGLSYGSMKTLVQTALTP